MTGGTVDELVRLVSQRRPLLDELRAGETTKADLVASLDASRSTIDRAVRELESVDVVTRRHGRVQLTLAGRLVLDAYHGLRDAVDGVERANGLLTHLPADAPFDPEFFAGANVVNADETSPYRPVTTMEEIIREADTVRSYATTVVPGLIDAFTDGIFDGRLDVEMVVTDAVLDTLVAEHSDALRATLDSGHLTLLSREQCVPYGFFIACCPGDDRVGVVTAGDHGYVAAVENDHPDAVSWLDGLFESVRAGATPVDAAP